MSRVSISKSYAVLVGMEGYTRTKRKIKDVESSLEHGKEKILHPDKVRQQDEQQKDKSQSAEKERRYLENARLEEEKKRQGRSKDERLSARVARKLRLGGKEETNREELGSVGRGIPGVGPEDGVPPPEGKR